MTTLAKAPPSVIDDESLKQLAVEYLKQKKVVDECHKRLAHSQYGHYDPTESKKELAVQSSRLAQIASQLIYQSGQLDTFQTIVVQDVNEEYEWMTCFMAIEIDFSEPRIIRVFPVALMHP